MKKLAFVVMGILSSPFFNSLQGMDNLRQITEQDTPYAESRQKQDEDRCSRPVYPRAKGEAYNPTAELLKAVQNNELEAAITFLGLGANANATYEDKTPVLWTAAKLRNVKLVLVLVSAGAQLNPSDLSAAEKTVLGEVLYSCVYENCGEREKENNSRAETLAIAAALIHQGALLREANDVGLFYLAFKESALWQELIEEIEVKQPAIAMQLRRGGEFGWS